MFKLGSGFNENTNWVSSLTNAHELGTGLYENTKTRIVFKHENTNGVFVSSNWNLAQNGLARVAAEQHCHAEYRGTSLTRNSNPPGTTAGP